MKVYRGHFRADGARAIARAIRFSRKYPDARPVNSSIASHDLIEREQSDEYTCVFPGRMLTIKTILF